MNVDKIIMYLRKSRADSAEETVEEVLQRHEGILQEFSLKTFGKVIPPKNIYREVVSGESIDSRPEMKKVLSLVANGDYEGVLVVEPQRLSRGDMLDCGTIVRVFRFNRVKIITPTKTFNLEEKYDRKFLEMDLQQGNDYLEYVKVILNRGRIASIKEGNFIGNTPPFGYDKTKIDGHYTLKPNKDADIVRLIFDLYVKKDLGCNQIANELDKQGIKPPHNDYWSAASIKGMLSNPVYIGKIRWNYKKTVKTTDEFGNTISKRPRNSPDTIIVNGLHPPIIDNEIFEKAQEKASRNSRVPGNRELCNPFATLVKCGNCGHGMSYRQYKDSNGKPRCNPRLLCSHQTHCHTPSIEYNEFVKSVISALKFNVANFEVELKKLENSSDELMKNIIANQKKELEALEVQQNKLYDLLEKGIYSDELFLKRNKELAKRRTELKTAIEKSEQEIPKIQERKERIYKLHRVIKSLQDDNVTPAEKNFLLKEILDKIVYNADNRVKGNRYRETPFTIDLFLK